MFTEIVWDGSHVVAALGGSVTVIVTRKIVSLVAKIGGLISACLFMWKLFSSFPRTTFLTIGMISILALLTGCSANRVELEAREQLHSPIGVQDFGGSNYCSKELLDLRASDALSRAGLRKIYRDCVDAVKSSRLFINPFNRYRRNKGDSIKEQQHEGTYHSVPDVCNIGGFSHLRPYGKESCRGRPGKSCQYHVSRRDNSTLCGA